MTNQPTALVSGGGRGIGEAICRALAAAGARVLVAGREREGLERVAAELRAAGQRAEALELDVTEAAAVARAARDAGTVDWLINNAGIAESAPILRRAGASNDELFERQLAVNLHGARRLLEAFGPAMLARGSGTIVNVVSSAGMRGYPYTAAYTASKHALLGYTRVAHLELGRKGLRVHAVCPHYVDSPMTDASVERITQMTGRSATEARANLASQNPGGRLVSAAEVAGSVLALCNAARSGRLIELDGSGRALERDL
jgi:3-hydroxybutyrate dehydrogenase